MGSVLSPASTGDSLYTAPQSEISVKHREHQFIKTRG